MPAATASRPGKEALYEVLDVSRDGLVEVAVLVGKRVGLVRIPEEQLFALWLLGAQVRDPFRKLG